MIYKRCRNLAYCDLSAKFVLQIKSCCLSTSLEVLSFEFQYQCRTNTSAFYYDVVKMVREKLMTEHFLPMQRDYFTIIDTIPVNMLFR